MFTGNSFCTCRQSICSVLLLLLHNDHPAAEHARHTRPACSHRLPRPTAAVEEDAAKYITDLFARGGDHTTVLLEQGAQYNLYSVIVLKGHYQELATEGYPEENVSKARLFTRGKDEAGAVHGVNKHYQAIRNIAIHGCRTDYGWLKGGAALVALGDWDAVEPAVENCVLADPRGWSCCHLIDGAKGARAINNLIGPAGQPPPHGPWADGLSVACRDGIIANNTIIDATDGAIVLFCAPGTLVTCNTIIARTRNLLGGINQVDIGPFKGNYTGTRVVNNRIVSEGAFIHLAMGIGSTTWSDCHDMQVYGGSVLGNVVGPGSFGYGIAAAGCRDYTVLQNRIAPNTTFSGDMEVISKVSPPTPFLRIDDGWAEGTFQDGFVEGPVRYLIGIKGGLSRSLQYHAGAVQFEGGSVIELQNVRIELSKEGPLRVWDRQSGSLLWSSPAPRGASATASDAPFKLTLDRKTGRLQIISRNGIQWDPMTFVGQCNYSTSTNDPILILSDSSPYIQVKDGGNTLYAAQPQWRHFDLPADCFVAVSSDSQSNQDAAQPPPIPHESRPTSLREALSQLHVSDHTPESSSYQHKSALTGTIFLWLDPATSQLVLHASRDPRHVEERGVIWRSPNWKKLESDSSNASKAILQGDGNLVIYVGKNGAIWATGSNGKNVDSLKIYPVSSEMLPGRLSLCSGNKVVWSSN